MWRHCRPPERPSGLHTTFITFGATTPYSSQGSPTVAPPRQGTVNDEIQSANLVFWLRGGRPLHVADLGGLHPGRSPPGHHHGFRAEQRGPPPMASLRARGVLTLTVNAAGPHWGEAP